jgi:hypothetical protein
MRQYGGAMDVQFLVRAGITQLEEAAPIELLVGTIVFDGSDYASNDVVLIAYFDSTLVGAGSAYMRCYDVGPAAGPPAAAVQITAALPSAFAMGTTTAGPQYFATSALVRAGAPAAGVIMNTARRYEFRAYISAGVNSTLVVGSTGFFVNS